MTDAGSSPGYSTHDQAFRAAPDYPVTACNWHWARGTETPVSGDLTTRARRSTETQ